MEARIYNKTRMSFISHSVFELIFKDAMATTKMYQSKPVGEDKDGNIIYEEEEFSITPRLVIRDFETGEDTEFDNEEKAWEFYDEIRGNCRVMNNAGLIYLDAFTDERTFGDEE